MTHQIETQWKGTKKSILKSQGIECKNAGSWFDVEFAIL
jgi:hypothetical protein